MRQNQKKRFGTIAVEKGYITEKELMLALQVQTKENLESGGHRLLGQILVDLDYLSDEQVDEIVEFMNNQFVYMLSIGR